MRSVTGLVILLAFSAAGATCKGSDGQKNTAPKTRPDKAAEPEEEPARPAFTELEGVDIRAVPPSNRAEHPGARGNVKRAVRIRPSMLSQSTSSLSFNSKTRR